MSSSRLSALFGGVAFPVLMANNMEDDPYDAAYTMLSQLDSHLSPEFKQDGSLRFHGASYLVHLKRMAHALWEDYSCDMIGDKELAFVVERAARESRQQIELLGDVDLVL